MSTSYNSREFIEALELSKALKNSSETSSITEKDRDTITNGARKYFNDTRFKELCDQLKPAGDPYSVIILLNSPLFDSIIQRPVASTAEEQTVSGNAVSLEQFQDDHARFYSFAVDDYPQLCSEWGWIEGLKGTPDYNQPGIRDRRLYLADRLEKDPLFQQALANHTQNQNSGGSR